MKRKICYAFFLCFCFINANAQDGYQPPKDELVIKKLGQWQDKKFGLFMHWGAYSQWGVTESWTICPGDQMTRTGPYSANYFEYKKAYENLQTTFNPVKFNPQKWAAAAKDAGMKYVIFTTKHHDGFCMFDSKYTDYKVTSPKTPFSTNPKSNVTKEIFNTFRNNGFMIGAYFSKPDWHSEYYWWPYFPPRDNNVNYSTVKYPERWKKFQDFTYNQIEELMTGYGSIDILWLDGGWVRPSSVPNDPANQDINMPRIAKMARSHQPGLIVVDRTVTGEYENYTTPEQEVPDKPLPYPWETCMTMGTQWSYKPNDTYKSPYQLVQLLVKIVSRGGNLLLNIGPDGSGDWDPVVYDRLKDIGLWMKINGEGIDGSIPVSPYSADNIYFTKAKTQNKIYAFWLAKQEDIVLPAQVNISLNNIKQIKKVSLLGKQQKLQWVVNNDVLSINIPASVRQDNGMKYAVTFKIEYN